MLQQYKFLKKRAKEFWKSAQQDLKCKRFNLSCLHIEQSVQLYIKYLISLKAADFPKTHYLNKLIEELAEVYNSASLKNFYNDNILQFSSLENAYITSRYLPKEFTREDVNAYMEFAKKLFKVLEKISGEKFI